MSNTIQRTTTTRGRLPPRPFDPSHRVRVSNMQRNHTLCEERLEIALCRFVYQKFALYPLMRNWMWIEHGDEKLLLVDVANQQPDWRLLWVVDELPMPSSGFVTAATAVTRFTPVLLEQCGETADALVLLAPFWEFRGRPEKLHHELLHLFVPKRASTESMLRIHFGELQPLRSPSDPE